MKTRSNRIVNVESKVGLTVRNIAGRCVVLIVVIAVLLTACSVGFSQDQKLQSASLPQLRTANQVTQLYVDDKPFLALGGEVGNSTASDLSVLETAFQKCQRMNLNTVMLPVYWNLIEPEEGKFDFTLVQGAIDRARSHDLHLVYLWFGTWKNSMSCYAPGWVKRDTARFEQVKQADGEIEEIITPESAAANEADAQAFAKLMRWTKDYDSRKQTVIMAQVENEIGMIPDPRDHSERSDATYKSKVPRMLQLAAKGKLGPEVEALLGKSRPEIAGQMERSFWYRSARRRSVFRVAVLDVCRKGGGCG